MLWMISGILLFFGIHSVAIISLPLRDRLAMRSELGWKFAHSVLAIAGLYLMIQGYHELKLNPRLLYVPPLWLSHLSALLLLPVFSLLFAPYFPGRIKRLIKHPQLLGVQLWAGAHLLVNGSVADVLLFGSFLVWAIIDRISMQKREPRSIPGAPESSWNDFALIIIGLGLYLATIFWLHHAWIGVRPFG